jgi:hypothetical protein
MPRTWPRSLPSLKAAAKLASGPGHPGSLAKGVPAIQLDRIRPSIRAPGRPLEPSSADIHPRLDPLEAGVHDADELRRRENPPRQRSQDPVLPQHADLEGDLLNLLQRLPAKPDRQGIRWLDKKRTKRHWNCHI